MTGPGRPTAGQRLRVAALHLAVGVLRRLPDHLVFRAAYVAGAGLSLVMHERRELVRANLRQVCRGLVARGLGSERVRRAATDGRALAALTRSAFGHWALGYVESAVTSSYPPQRLRERVHGVGTGAAAEALAAQRSDTVGRIFVSPHFGSVELAALYGVAVGGLRMVAPMETVADPALQAYFERMRGSTGIRIVPIRGASTVLRAALAAGDAVALVADRAIGGMGMPVELFGAPARLPLGPAVLAIESGAPVYVVGIRRTGWGEWATHVERLEPTSGESLRERIAAQLDARARAFERIVAEAPDQWWTCFFPIWKQPSGERREVAREGGAAAADRDASRPEAA